MLSRVSAGVTFRERLMVFGDEKGARVNAKPTAGVVTFEERHFEYSMSLRAKQIRLNIAFWGDQELELRLFQDKWLHDASSECFTGHELADFCIEVLVNGAA